MKKYFIQLKFWSTDDYKIILKLFERNTAFWKRIYLKMFV